MKNRATKIISLALCAVVLFAAVGTSGFALTGEGKESEDENQTTTINVSAEAETSKDETVYVLAGADGTVQKIIVSDWIKNAMATDSLDDKTELSDIENIKGDESFDESIANFDPSSLFDTNVPGAGDYADLSNYGAGLAGDVGDIAGNTGAIKDSMDITEEDLKYLRDIAEQEAINRFTTAEITIEQTNHNTVSGKMDLDGVVDGLTGAVNEAADIIAEGVHE